MHNVSILFLLDRNKIDTSFTCNIVTSVEFHCAPKVRKYVTKDIWGHCLYGEVKDI